MDGLPAVLTADDERSAESILSDGTVVSLSVGGAAVSPGQMARTAGAVERMRAEGLVGTTRVKVRRAGRVVVARVVATGQVRVWLRVGVGRLPNGISARFEFGSSKALLSLVVGRRS